MIIGLSGYAQSGKDTAADYISGAHDFEKASFAGLLRDCLAALNPIVRANMRYNDVVEMYGYEKAKKEFPEVRELLQRMGTDVGRDILGPDTWVDALARSIDVTRDYVFADTRFPNEFDFVKAHGGVMIRVNREGCGPINDHISEIGLDNHDFDFYVENNDTLEAFRWDLGVLMRSLMFQ